MFAEKADRLGQQIAEIDGVQRLQPLLVVGIHLAALAFAIAAVVALGDVGGGKALVLPAVDHAGEQARGPALVVYALGLDQLLQQADLVVGVEDGEVGFQPDELGMAAQDFHADRVEGAEPGHALDLRPHVAADALLHLARGLVGEGHGEDLRGPGAAGGQDVRDARDEHAGLAGARAGQHQQRAFGGLDRVALLGVEALEPGHGRFAATARAEGTRGDAARLRLRAVYCVRRGVGGI